jgi:EAL domain-containing protein (putative c-di-GMP-specific phosphodiesterase class I)
LRRPATFGPLDATWSVVVFGIGQDVGIGGHLVSIDSYVRASANIAANGFLLAAMAHRCGPLVGARLIHLSDREPRRTEPIAFAVLLIGNGAVVALSRVEHAGFAFIGLGLGIALQSVALAWVLAAWLEDGSLSDVWRRVRDARGLERALRAGEIEPRFDQISDTSTGVCMGMAVKPHWLDRKGRALGADEIHVALHRSGGLDRLEPTMVLHAARHRSMLAKDHVERVPFVAFSVTSRLIDKPGYAVEISALLATEGLVAAGTVLKISADYESADWPTMAQNVVDARALGMQVAVCGYGNGPTNLRLLSELTLDYIGFDQTFVGLAATTGRGAAIARAAVHIAQSVGTRAIAEGVHDPTWTPELRRLGFDLFESTAAAGKRMPAAQPGH